MKRFDLAVMYFCAALTLCVMYATQPLQPLFEEILGINKFQASLFTTSIMMPLAFASIFYGYILEKFSIKKILIFSFLGFGILELCFGLSSNYFLLLNIRGIQGLIAPAALTGIMSYISSNSDSSKVGSAIGVYIAITILGGFVGRFLSGLSYDIFGNWRVFFFVLSGLLFVATMLLSRINEAKISKTIKPRLSDIVSTFRMRENAYICLFILFVFFAFQAVLNFLPFEISKIKGEFSGTKTGFMYAGYFIGFLVSINSKKIVRILKTPARAMFVGVGIFIVGILGLSVANFSVIFLSMLVVCLGNFIAHAVASGYINFLAKEHKGIANGLYVSFYYLGGALGSFVSGVFYINFGWSIFLLVLIMLLAISLIFAYKLGVLKSEKISA